MIHLPARNKIFESRTEPWFQPSPCWGQHLPVPQPCQPQQRARAQQMFSLLGPLEIKTLVDSSRMKSGCRKESPGAGNNMMLWPVAERAARASRCTRAHKHECGAHGCVLVWSHLSQVSQLSVTVMGSRMELAAQWRQVQHCCGAGEQGEEANEDNKTKALISDG